MCTPPGDGRLISVGRFSFLRYETIIEKLSRKDHVNYMRYTFFIACFLIGVNIVDYVNATLLRIKI